MEAVARGLQRHGHQVITAATGQDALDAYLDADVVLLKLELPDMDGLQVCRTMRATSDVPVIAVTDRDSELDLVLGLQAGCDDYIAKPYGFRELMARMGAVMRRANPHQSASRVLSRGHLRIDTSSREVTVGERPVEMTRKEFDLLCLLASSPDTVVPRKQIMQQLWRDSWSRRTLDTHVSSLRGKLGDSQWIVTVRGVGFRLGLGRVGAPSESTEIGHSDARTAILA